MAEDRLDEGWSDIPDPIASRSGLSPRVVQPPSNKSPTRSAIRTRRMVALVACIVWLAVVLVRWGVRAQIAEQSSFIAERAVVICGLLLTAGFIAVSPGKRGLGWAVSLAQLAAVGAPVAFMVIGLSWLPAGSPGSFGDIGPASQISPCLSLGLLLVVPLVLVALWAMQHAFPAAARWRAAALGAAVGLLGSLMLTLHCGSPFGGHVALAHGLPIVIAAMVGAALGSRVTRA